MLLNKYPQLISVELEKKKPKMHEFAHKKQSSFFKKSADLIN